METRARERADQVGSNFRSQATIFGYLTESCRRLVGLVTKAGEDYWTESNILLVTGGLASMTFPVDAWKLLELRVDINGERVKLHRAPVDMINAEITPSGWADAARIGYRLRGTRIHWAPTPTVAHTVSIEYLPTKIFKDLGGTPKASLTVTTDTFDGIFGWDEFVSIDVAIKLKSDNEKDVSALLLERGEVLKAILAEASERDANEPPRSRDTWRGGAEADEAWE